MTTKLFSLKGVPDDEAAEIRELLHNQGIDYYETPAGNWGISVAAIWLNDDSQVARAKLLIEQYQRERLIRVKEEYAQLQKEGKQRTVIDLIKENPVRFFVYLVVIAIILYFSTKPFMEIGL